MQSVASPPAARPAQSHPDTADTKNVNVVLRLRPADKDDTAIPPRFRTVLVHPVSRAEVRVDVDPATLAGHGSSGPHTATKRHPTFTFDSVLGEDAQQTDLYDATARERVDEFMTGHNVTFLAYGQTSSGKSYSMGTTGEDIDYSGTRFTPRTGLIPRTVQSIFERAEEIKSQSGPGASWEARITFLELYNEEIIDLLSENGVTISIREERDGRIGWHGATEFKVKSLAEVMHLLQDGSTRRKTGETTMNATSSRSHAIFSLTLVQKKLNGPLMSAQSAPRSETPTRSLRRPSSMVGFSGPGGPRSPTPSSARAGPPSSFSRLNTPSRPSSVVGTPTAGDDFVIVTSKFNMVDLAGSERLKRTAAQGDRMKEGISINSGLLALGNVISTLCDPVKARGHVPYRDSKLTRMLQDSIGGNALTTMIACISPIEANIGETLNTIKYASRARNIRNQAKVNQVEAGWDDVEYLQNTVSKLRKQLAAIEGGGKASLVTDESMRQSEKLIQRLAELQREHTELYDRYLAKCSENMRLSSDLKNRGPGDADALTRFNQTVEPVILEYEKVVSALNQQLDDLRGDIAIMNDMSEEHVRHLQEARDRQAQSESYVAELRSRLAKLTEHGTTSEAYIQDLEIKLKSYTAQEEIHSNVVAELKKDIGRLREQNDASSLLAADLETKLVKSEAQSLDLAAQVEKQEKRFEALEIAYRDLEAQIVRLDADEAKKGLVAELARRDRIIVDLELEVEERGLAQARQQGLLDGIQAEKSARATSDGVSTSDRADDTLDSLAEDVQQKAVVHSEHNTESSDLETLRVAWKDLSARYAESQTRIADLVTQLSEAKLVQGEMDDVVPISPTTPAPLSENGESDTADESTELEHVVTPVDSSPGSSHSERQESESTSIRRTSMPVLSHPGVAVKQGFRAGRGYSSSSSKKIRPQSLSQELSSAQSLALSPRATWSQPITKFTSVSSPDAQGTLHSSLRTLHSLETELKFVHRVIEERDKELRDQEAYIKTLEEQLEVTKTHHILSLENRAKEEVNTPETPSTPVVCAQAVDVPLPPSPKTPLPSTSAAQKVLNEVSEGSSDSLRPPEEGLREGGMTPKSLKRFSLLADSLRALENGQGAVDEQSKIQALMKEMSAKEASQRKIIEQQFIQIADLQKANYKLRDELYETLHVSPLESHEEHDSLVAEKIKAGSVVPSPASSPARSIDKSALDRLRNEHAEELQTIISGHAQTIGIVQQEHEVQLGKVYKEIEVNQSMIDKLNAEIEILKLEHHTSLTRSRQSMEDRESALAQEVEALRATHAEVVETLRGEHAKALQALQEEQDLISAEMESSLTTSEEQRRQLKMKADQALFELSRVRDEHALQRNTDAKQVAELTKANAQLEHARAELESAMNELRGNNAELHKKNAELEQRFGRKLVPPPQGPPPRAPLPPLPRSPSGNVLRSENGHNGAGEKRQSESSSNGHAQAVSEPGGQTLYAVSAEQEVLRNESGRNEEKIKEIETKLQEEKGKVNSLTADLREAQRTAAALRSHLENARSETKRTSSVCREHTAELEARREQMSTITEDQRVLRDSLKDAQGQVTSLKMQLERAIDKKVAKRGLRCF